MSTSRRKTYHHGNLSDAALKAAINIVMAEGHDALSARRVAQAVGVAHRALYNHFANKDALLDAVAMQGFKDLAAAVEPATTRPAFIKAYVNFALQNRNLFTLMMNRPHATMSDNPPLQSAVHLVITKAFEFFASEDATPLQNRRRVMHAYILLSGALNLRESGILDVAGDEAFLADLIAMSRNI